MNTINRFLQRNALVAYFVLAYAITWSLFPLAYVSLGFAVLPLFGPAFAAILVTAFTGGRQGVKDLLSRAVRWRVRWQWYAFAVGFPFVLTLLASGISALLGQPATLKFGGLLSVAFAPLFIGEELGWRGYALPRLLERTSALVASLLLGVLWAGWHLPNFLLNIPGVPAMGPFPAFLIWVVAETVMFTWLFQRTRRSVLIATLFHASINAFFVDHPSLAWQWALMAGVWAIAAVFMILTNRPKPATRPAI